MTNTTLKGSACEATGIARIGVGERCNCVYAWAVMINGKRLCLRHARVEALKIALASGKAKAR